MPKDTNTVKYIFTCTYTHLFFYIHATPSYFLWFREFFNLIEASPFPIRAANFHLCSALTPVAERLAMEMSLHVSGLSPQVIELLSAYLKHCQVAFLGGGVMKVTLFYNQAYLCLTFSSLITIKFTSKYDSIFYQSMIVNPVLNNKTHTRKNFALINKILCVSDLFMWGFYYFC